MRFWAAVADTLPTVGTTGQFPFPRLACQVRNSAKMRFRAGPPGSNPRPQSAHASPNTVWTANALPTAATKPSPD